MEYGPVLNAVIDIEFRIMNGGPTIFISPPAVWAAGSRNDELLWGS